MARAASYTYNFKHVQFHVHTVQTHNNKNVDDQCGEILPFTEPNFFQPWSLPQSPSRTTCLASGKSLSELRHRLERQGTGKGRTGNKFRSGSSGADRQETAAKHKSARKDSGVAKGNKVESSTWPDQSDQVLQKVLA